MSGPLRWDLATVAAATGGHRFGAGDVVVDSVVVDSRMSGPGTLFVARHGERQDGHDFASAALEGGAAAVLVEAGRCPGLEPRVEVRSTDDALIGLAARRRSELDIPVTAITGSTGKTSTKDLLAAALGPGTWASPRSFNNEVGLPLTVLATPPDARHLVLEAGSRGRGHIARLAPAIRPRVAVITNIGVVHLETFGSRRTLAEAKWELVEALEPGGIAVLPQGGIDLGHEGQTITFGEADRADVRARGVTLDERGRPSFVLEAFGETVAVRLAMAGRHQPLNAAAAAAAAIAVGESLPAAAGRMEEAVGSSWRMEITAGWFTVVNDAYNANPDSMASALRTVAAMGGRRIAVLGMMAELGPVEEEEHVRIGALAVELGFDPIVIVGRDPGLAAGAGGTALAVADAAEAMAAVHAAIRPGDLVLVKASRAVGLERLALDLAAVAERMGAR